jgi:hypothetical protein
LKANHNKALQVPKMVAVVRGQVSQKFESKSQQWKQKFLLIAPVDGQIQILNFHKTNDYVQTGNEIFSIIPPASEIIGQVYLPEKGAGKVRVNQQVTVKLNNFPFLEYGAVKGRVQNISLIPNQQQSSDGQKVNLYLVTVKFPDGLKTNYGRNLDFNFDGKGTAEIVTRDRRLVDRIFANFRQRMQ